MALACMTYRLSVLLLSLCSAFLSPPRGLHRGAHLRSTQSRRYVNSDPSRRSCFAIAITGNPEVAADQSAFLSPASLQNLCVTFGLRLNRGFYSLTNQEEPMGFSRRDFIKSSAVTTCVAST